MPPITPQMISDVLAPNGHPGTAEESQQTADTFRAQQPEAMRYLDFLANGLDAQYARDIKTGFLIGVVCAMRAMEMQALQQLTRTDDEIASAIVSAHMRERAK